jgi:2-polyprenyl-6-methoxyphenol hydroxylase-like FAD-dependent oxidoreductase
VGGVRRLGAAHGEVLGAPVAEYLPARLVRGRAALIGDAAHVASPMTGAGFENALLDAEALAAALRSATAPDAPDSLDSYERERPPQAQRLVSSGMSWGRSASPGYAELADRHREARGRPGCRDGTWRVPCHQCDDKSGEPEHGSQTQASASRAMSH